MITILDSNENMYCTIAACARISRSRKKGNERLKEARFDEIKAEKTAKEIYSSGHESIIEHGFLTLEFDDYSRLATRNLLMKRLISPTELSQRYVKIINPKESGLKNNSHRNNIDDFVSDAFVIPKELDKNPVLKEEYEKDLENRIQAYFDFIQEGIPKEDARYILGQSTITNVVISANLREWFNIYSELYLSNLEEHKEMEKELYSVLDYVASDLFKIYENKLKRNLEGYEQKNSIIKKSIQNTSKLVKEISEKVSKKELNSRDSNVNLKNIYGIDEAILLLSNKYGSLDEMNKGLYYSIQKSAEGINFFTKELEFVNYLFEMKMSQSAFRQFLRHRMTTKTILEESLFEYVIPKTINNHEISEIDQKYKEVQESINKNIEKAYEYNEDVARYMLSNAHLLKVYSLLNLRELYHISQLRECYNSQWELRSIAKSLSNLAKENTPFLADYLGPKCYLLGYCPEGKYYCGNLMKVLEEYGKIDKG